MPGLLLDTHTALWWWTGLRVLPEAARSAIAVAPSISVSAVSALEIAIKHRIGKLDMIGDPMINYPRLMAEHRFLRLDITEDHALAAGKLPGSHGDPFDRIIAAQALAENMTVITRDPQIAAFGCRILW